MFEFKITDEFLHFAKKQITQVNVDTDFYLKMSISEFNAIKNYLKKPQKVLELGCGLGRMSIFLNSQLDEPKPYFILADVNKESSSIKYGWNPKESYYNSLDLTARFAQLHDLTNFETFDLLNQDLSSLSEIDLVMSYLSVGFHYPIEDYLEKLFEVTTDDCQMIFGIRKGKYNPKDFEKYFKSVNLVKNSIETKEEILILSQKR